MSKAKNPYKFKIDVDIAVDEKLEIAEKAMDQIAPRRERVVKTGASVCRHSVPTDEHCFDCDKARE